MDTDKDKLRQEVENFFEKYDGLDDEELDELLTALIVQSYPTQDGQNS